MSSVVGPARAMSSEYTEEICLVKGVDELCCLVGCCEEIAIERGAIALPIFTPRRLHWLPLEA